MLAEAPPPSPRVFATWTAVPTQVQPFPVHMACMGSVRAQCQVLLWRHAEGLRYRALWRRCGPAPATAVSCAPSLATKCPELTGVRCRVL